MAAAGSARAVRELLAPSYVAARCVRTRRDKPYTVLTGVLAASESALGDSPAVAHGVHTRRRARPRRPLARLLLAVVIVAAVSLPAGAAAMDGSKREAQLSVPGAGEVRLAARITDSRLSPGATHRLAAGVSDWGGPFRTPQGETVTIRVSDAYPEDPARAQRWADFLGSLIHGSELSSLTVYLAPLDEVQSLCGFGSLACYSPDRSLAVAPGENPFSDTSAEAILTHEYGHHVAANRTNAPWPAVEWGTKRWASYQQVCARAREGELFPGADTPFLYDRNPGEGFAESYRLLNERRAGRPETPWEVVDRILYPDDTALALLEQDVVSPWTANASTTFRGTLRRTGATRRTFRTATALDGTLTATATAPRARVSVAVLADDGRVVARSRAAATSATARTTVCGTRSLRVRVTRASGSGAFQLRVSKP
jgi:hypothetical protein